MNNSIYECFRFLNEHEQRKFIKKFKDQPHTSIQIMHTFRELLLGAFLSKMGFIVESDKKIDNKTPDWALLNSSQDVIGIVEQITHHLDSKTNDGILSQINSIKSPYAYFPHGNDPHFERLYDKLQKKAAKYESLLQKRKIPCVVSVFMDFLTVVDVDETKTCLLSGDKSLFGCYPNLSGVLHFEEANNGNYAFSFIENPFALYKISIPNGNLMTSANLHTD